MNEPHDEKERSRGDASSEAGRSRQGERKVYQPPRLVRYGEVDELTGGSGSTIPDMDGGLEL